MLKIGKNEVRISMVIKLSGAFCAFLIGAGFATGQEVMQYFTNYGLAKGIGVMVVNCVLGAWTAGAIMSLGKETKDEQGLNCYRNLCGKYIGTLLSWFIPIFMFLSLVIMIAGFGATLNQLFGAPAWVGCLVFAVIVTGTVLLGLARVIDTIGFMGPLIIIVTTIMAIAVLIKFGFDLETWETYINTHDVLLAADSWFMSGVLYALWNIVLGMPFMSAMGAKSKNKAEVILGAVFGNILFTIGLLFLVLAEGSQLDVVGELSIPALAMAEKVSPILYVIYAVVVIMAIYTTAVPLMWSVASRVSKEKTLKFAIICLIIAVLGFFGGQLPFEQLINYIYPLIGYVGFIQFLFIIWREIKMIRGVKSGDPLPDHKE